MPEFCLLYEYACPAASVYITSGHRPAKDPSNGLNQTEVRVPVAQVDDLSAKHPITEKEGLLHFRVRAKPPLKLHLSYLT